MILCGAYGSIRHLSVYKELGLQPDQIYLHGNSKKSSGSTGKGKSEYQVMECVCVCVCVCVWAYLKLYNYIKIDIEFSVWHVLLFD